MRLLPVAAFAALLAMPAAQAQLAPGYGPNITLDAAQKVIQAGVADAQAKKLQMAVTVLDTAGNMVAFARVDGTQTASITVAIEKAKSAVGYRRPTKVFEDALVGGRMAILALPGAMPVEGGLLLVANNQVIGSVGVSGGTSAEDGQVAAAAVAGLGK